MILALAATACYAPSQPLRVGANTWPGYEPLYLARSLGYYPADSIQLIEFASSAELVRAYRNGLVDVAALTADEAISASPAQPGQRIVLVCDYSNGADALVAQPRFRSIRDLKGRRVGVETAALGAYMLARALEKGGLAAGDVEVRPLQVLDHERAFLAGEVDAVVSFEPHVSRMAAKGGRVLFDSTQVPGEIVDVLVTTAKLPRAQDRALGRLVSGWFKALDHLEKDPLAAAALMAPRENVSPQQFLGFLKRLHLPGREEAHRLLDDPGAGLQATLVRISETLHKERLGEAVLEVPRLDARYIRAAKP